MSAARPSASFDHGTLLDGHLQQLLYCRPDGTCLVPRCRSGSPDSHHGHQSFAEGHGSPHDDWYLCRHDIYSHVYPLVVGQAIGRDFYAKTINKEATPEKEVFVTRVAVTVVALACMLFNYTNPPHFLSISFILDSVASAPASACRFSLGLSVTAVRKRARLLLPSWVPPHIWYSHMPWALISGFPACWPYWSRHS